MWPSVKEVDLVIYVGVCACVHVRVCVCVCVMSLPLYSRPHLASC